MSESGGSQSDKQDLSRQGKKGMRGRPLYYDEVKEKKHFMLTPTAIEILEELAAKQALDGCLPSGDALSCRRLGSICLRLDVVIALINQRLKVLLGVIF